MAFWVLGAGNLVVKAIKDAIQQLSSKHHLLCKTFSFIIILGTNCKISILDGFMGGRTIVYLELW